MSIKLEDIKICPKCLQPMIDLSNIYIIEDVDLIIIEITCQNNECKFSKKIEIKTEILFQYIFEKGLLY